MCIRNYILHVYIYIRKNNLKRRRNIKNYIPISQPLFGHFLGFYVVRIESMSHTCTPLSPFTWWRRRRRRQWWLRRDGGAVGW